jgi:hypothetical protein
MQKAVSTQFCDVLTGIENMDFHPPKNSHAIFSTECMSRLSQEPISAYRKTCGSLSVMTDTTKVLTG